MKQGVVSGLKLMQHFNWLGDKVFLQGVPSQMCDRVLNISSNTFEDGL